MRENLQPPRGGVKGLTLGQQNLLLARMRALNLDPQADLAIVLGRLAGGRALADLEGTALDRVLAELPALARELTATAPRVSVADLFGRVRGLQSFDGDWSNAAASFLCRTRNLIRDDAALLEFQRAAARSIDLPPDFRAELIRQVRADREVVA